MSNNHINKFKERLNLCLKDQKISQKELSQKTGLSPSIINNYCTGKREPSLNALILVCNELNESADFLLGRTEY